MVCSVCVVGLLLCVLVCVLGCVLVAVCVCFGVCVSLCVYCVINQCKAGGNRSNGLVED